jgi:uncharacterized protein
METRISLITLGVNDLAKARAFYDQLGWKNQSGELENNIVTYDLIGATLALYPLDMLSKDLGMDLQKPETSTITLAYNTRSKDEVDQVLNEAVEAGAELVKPGAEVFWGGYSGYFKDPEGTLWEVSFNPFAPLGKDGSFQWNGQQG